MFDDRARWSLVSLLALCLGGSWALAAWSADRRRAGEAPSPGMEAARPNDRSRPSRAPRAGRPPRADEGRAARSAADRPRGPLRWIVAGGGPDPEHNQVQLEQDVALAEEVFSDLGPGLTLYAGGAGSRAVQVLEPPGAARAAADPVRARLGSLFDPRAGRDSRYRRTALSPDGRSSAEAILSAIEGALLAGEAPLTLYLAGHGLGGESPHESRFLTWGAHDLWVEDVATVLDQAPGHRPLRLVVTACHAGGFAELAFEGADPQRGAAMTDRCGLFATSWDRAASGCDPNPERSAQEGYGVHFLHALRREDRHGRPLEPRDVDFDGDGAVSLLEAHTRARIASGSLDVPVTTSERFLRFAVAPATAPRSEGTPRVDLPEEEAAVSGLMRRLELREARAVAPRLDELRLQLDERAGRIDELDLELAEAEEEVKAELLHRWPVLDDPWHPAFDEVFRREREAIERSLEESAAEARRAELARERERVAEEHDGLLVRIAVHERLARALETRELAARLRAIGGQPWLRYQVLLSCERTDP